MTEVTDGNWRLFAYDHETKRSIWIQWIDGMATFRIDTPVDQIIEANKINLNGDHPARFGDFVRIASVPLQHYHETGMAEAMSQKDERFVSRWINNGDNRAWRTRDGNF